MALQLLGNWHVIKMEYSSSSRIQEKYFSESDQFAYQETSAQTSDLNHPSKDHVNYISTDFFVKHFCEKCNVGLHPNCFKDCHIKQIVI